MRREPASLSLKRRRRRPRCPLMRTVGLRFWKQRMPHCGPSLKLLHPRADVVVLDDERVLQEVGIYRYHHPLENAAAYKDRLDELGGRIADLVKTNRAIEMSNTFTFDNSLAKGRKMANDLAKLMLRAYNAEVDNSLRSLRAGNVVTAKRRIEASRDAIRKLGAMMQMHISDAFHALRLEEDRVDR